MENINELLTKHDCSCGKTHYCNIKNVYIEDNAAARFTTLVKGYNKILVVSDANQYKIAGRKVISALKGRNVSYRIFGKKILIPDEETVNDVIKVSTGVDLIIGIGSGVIQDISKYVSFKLGIDYMIFATAPSMDGYASASAAMMFNGYKVTLPAHVPVAILADLDILCSAPYPMIMAGFGDIVGKYSSLNDWKLSHVITGEYFCQEIYDLTYNTLKKTVDLKDGLKARDKQSIKALMEALVIVGIEMSFAGNTRPASGSEHHLSHYFEVTSVLFGQNHLPHGTDVAFATVITSIMRERLMLTDWHVEQFKMDRSTYLKNMKKNFAEAASEYVDIQDKCGRYEEERIQKYLDNEQEIRSILSEMPSHAELEEILTSVGLEKSIFDKAYSWKRVKNSQIYAKDLKDRFNVLWMYYDIFGTSNPVEW